MASRGRSTARSATTAASAATRLVEIDRPGRRDVASTALTVTWPTSQTTQTFRDLAADQAIEITEGEATLKVVKQPPLKPPAR